MFLSDKLNQIPNFLKSTKEKYFLSFQRGAVRKPKPVLRTTLCFVEFHFIPEILFKLVAEVRPNTRI